VKFGQSHSKPFFFHDVLEPEPVVNFWAGLTLIVCFFAKDQDKSSDTNQFNSAQQLFTHIFFNINVF